MAPDAKVDARQAAVGAVTSGDYGHCLLAVRCNGLSTEWGSDDVAAVATARPAAMVVPKVDSVGALDDIAGRLDAGGAPTTSIWPMIETPTAIFDVRHLAAHPRVSTLVIGTNDLARELRAPLGVTGRANLTPYLAVAVLAARAAEKQIVDGVFNDIRDHDGFIAECRQGVEMGFDGKTLIHPAQVEPANAAWTPSDEEIEQARRVIDAFTAASAEGRGVATVDGRMVEALHVDTARRTLAIADATHPRV